MIQKAQTLRAKTKKTRRIGLHKIKFLLHSERNDQQDKKRNSINRKDKLYIP